MQLITFERIIVLWPRRVLIVALAGVLIVALMPRPSIAGQQLPQTTPAASASLEQLQQLVAPIALYPDALVAQILAAST